MGIHGPWGDGKTTVLNIIRSKLEASSDTVVVGFNPWRFTDESAMLAEFFRDLAATIRAKLTTKCEDIAGWIEKAGRFSSVVSDRFGTTSKVAATQAEVGRRPNPRGIGGELMARLWMHACASPS